MNKRELLESYGFDDVPEAQVPKYVAHLRDVVGVNIKDDKDTIYQDIIMADSIRKMRGLLDNLIEKAEEVCND